MNKTREQIVNFSGSKIHFGIDVHKNSWAVTTRIGEVEQKTFQAVPDVEKLKDYLERKFPGASFEGAYEAGFSGFWIYRMFQQFGIEIKVVHPADVPTTDKERDRKDDVRDSRKIARSLFNNTLNPIFVPSEKQESDRELIRSRSVLIRQQTRIKNQINSFLFRHNRVPEFDMNKWSIRHKRWLHSLEFNQPSTDQVLKMYLRRLEEVHKEILFFNKQIRLLSKTGSYFSDLSLLRTIPSIGILSGMILLTELGDLKRFKTEDELCSYAGLSPSTHSSGDNIRTGSISKRGNRWLRTTLIECSWIAIKHDPALAIAYNDLKKRIIGQKAIVRIAKKLLKRIRFVLMNRLPYQTGLK